MKPQRGDEPKQAATMETAGQVDPVCNALVAKMRAILLAELQQRYIWMSKAGVKQITEKVVSTLEEGIVEQHPLIAASKSRMNFLKLPLELRELVYRPVLIYHAHWDGRVEFPVTPNASSSGSSASEASTFPRDALRTPALLQTSQQVRRDTEYLYYSTTEFTTRWSLHQFYFNAPVDVAQRWLKHIGPRCRSMIKKFVVQIERGENEDDLEQRMKYMADRKLRQGFDNPYGFLRLRTNYLPEIGSLPRKLRTTVQWILEYIQLDPKDLESGVVDVRYPPPRHEFGPGESLSKSEVFCPFCYGVGEPDSARFLGGVCVDCKRSSPEGGMQVGYGRASWASW